MIISPETFVEACIFIVFIYAVVTEFNAISDNSSACSKAQSVAEASGASPCDMIASAAQLNANSERKLAIGWRRAIIAASTLTTLGPFALTISLSMQQKLGMFILTFFTVLSVEGFSNYYFSNATSLAVDSNLQLAIRTFDANTCSPGLQYQSLKQFLRPLQP